MEQPYYILYYEKYRALLERKGIANIKPVEERVRDIIALYGKLTPVDRFALVKHIEAWEKANAPKSSTRKRQAKK